MSPQLRGERLDAASGSSRLTHRRSVLRYIPFSTNASVGDTVKFVWGAGPHTVTQSSALTVCNKTSAPGAFASGQQDKGFECEWCRNLPSGRGLTV